MLRTFLRARTKNRVRMRKCNLKKVVVLAFTLMLLLIATEVAFIKPVASDPTETVHNLDTGLYYETIQEAINANETINGHTISVDAGTYYENVVVNKSISLIGENKINTIIDGTGLNYTGTLVTITADNVEMSRFTVINAGFIGIYVDDSQYCEVHENIVCFTGDRGIVFDQGEYNSAYNNIVYNSSAYGAIEAIWSNNNTIYNNLAYFNQWGIATNHGSYNRIYNNTVHSNRDSGIHIDWSSTGNIINGNNVSLNDNQAISVMNEASENTINNNEIIGNNNGGISFSNSSNNNIYENNVADNYLGIDLYTCSDNTLSGNSITENDAGGIVLYASSNNNTLSGNNITNNSAEGVYLYESSNNSITGNNITDNTATGILLYASSNNNTLSGNNIAENAYYGVYLFESSGNKFYLNNFVDNTWQVYSETSTNAWNEDYPYGGNYWSDYTGVDQYRGLYQSEIGEDGIWDNPYVIDENNQDNYPRKVPLSERSMVHIVFEEAHSPFFTIGDNPASGDTGGYSGFAEYLSANGYAVSTINPGTTIDESVLAPVDVLVIVAPQNNYSTSEKASIETWVHNGGSLLLISEWRDFAFEASAIATIFNITLELDDIFDSDENLGQEYWTYYEGTNLVYHPVTAGVARVEMYASDGIKNGPTDEISLIVTDTDGTASWEFLSSPAIGVSVMSALDGGTAGSGRFIVIADSNVWDSVYDFDSDGELDFYDSDNKVLALNAIDWLAERNELPVAIFTESATSANTYEEIFFDASGSYDTDGFIQNYNWDFDDGTNSSGVTVNHVYSEAGVFTITLTVTDNDGASDTATSIIYIVNSPPYQPQLTISPSLNVENNDDLFVTVIGPTPADPDGDSVTYKYRWLVDVGTGTFVDDEVAGRGNHTGNMVPATDTAVDDTWRVEVTPVDEHGSVGTSVIATWQTVVLPDTTNPVADAGPDQTVYEGTQVNFDGSTSTDNVGIVSYVWSFTDGTRKTLTSMNPNYIFATPNTYTVTLNVTDIAGNWDTDTVLITVLEVTTTDDTEQHNPQPDTAEPDVTKPLAEAGQDKLAVEGMAVSFDAGGSSDNLGIVSYEWDFGDGTSGTGIAVNHTYTEPGNYTVTLTVKDAVGSSNTNSITITVQKDTDRDSVPDVTDTDDDNDQMPDDWEIEHGLDPLDANDALLDADNNGLTNLYEYLHPTDKSDNVRILSSLLIVVAAFTATTAAILASLSGLGNAFDAAIEKLPLAPELREFLQLYGEKLFETVDKAKLEVLRKAPFITKGEVVALGFSAFIATIVIGSANAGGVASLFAEAGLAKFVNFIPEALISVCVVIIFAGVFEAFCARICSVHKQFKLWLYGIITFLVSGLVFGFPFGSPGITRYKSGEISEKAKGLFVLSKMLLLMMLMIPFVGLSMLGLDILGEIGLWYILITVFSSLIPVRPLLGKALFDYRKDVSLAALAFSGLLLFSIVYGQLAEVTILPSVIYFGVGVVSAFLAAITLQQLRKERST
jgi:parallel beta-helix repeat protein